MPPIDVAALDACEAARRRLKEQEAAVATARDAFETSVRRLYVDGASTREIAEVLGLSHQRVHQMIGAKPNSWWQRVTGTLTLPSRGCSFCGRDAKSVGKLVGGIGVHICDDCISAAASLVDTESGGPVDGPDGAGAANAARFETLPGTSPKRCSFCGQRPRSMGRFAAGGHQICAGCLRLAAKIAKGPTARSTTTS
ncbi:MAG: ClpX C4-type zinc finger protein [Hyphomicrobiaceae bacterium]